MSQDNTASSEVLIRVQATPNPNAWKFILDRPVLVEGKATYNSIEECQGNRLASDLLSVDGVKQVHLFGNVITITHRIDAEVAELQKAVCAVIQTRMPVHNPNVTTTDYKKAAREHLPPEVQKIEEILDRTIRPGLQGDGGDIEVVKLDENKLYIHYEGACGTCPSSTAGTLMAIEGILQDELGQSLEVIPV